MLVDFEKLKRVIDTTRDHQAKLIAERVLALLTECGVDIHAIVHRKELRSRILGKVEARYLEPETGVTWTGRGRMPRWLIGQNLKKFAIATETGSNMESEQSRLNLGQPSTDQAGSKISAAQACSYFTARGMACRHPGGGEDERHRL
ncbi:H-NS histone family protein [Burkholderia sp. Bp9004]|uniref:H-NS histone family protein n=1 Tax=Burkholderia sp. Bp9004 TaxID=2184559 RepID=UPI000F5FC920|nr:H-NS histone family protein [Burkholderia sp. Bp9004]RQZ58400.1 H-NS histone family protein [Burkholderia sp. Bp9004]